MQFVKSLVVEQGVEVRIVFTLKTNWCPGFIVTIQKKKIKIGFIYLFSWIYIFFYNKLEFVTKLDFLFLFLYFFLFVFVFLFLLTISGGKRFKSRFSTWKELANITKWQARLYIELNWFIFQTTFNLYESSSINFSFFPPIK